VNVSASEYTKKELVDFLIEQSKTINKQAPTMVDSGTRFDMTFVVDLVLNYKFTMINISKDDITNPYYGDGVKNKIKHNSCSSEKITEIFKLGISYNYLYYDKDGYILYKYLIGRNDCGI
jgi:hypothetical protein